MNSKSNRLFGFRSGSPVKKALALIYYAACIVFLIIGMLTPPLVPAGRYDTVLLRISTTILFLWSISPAIFLSDTPFRDSLPLFKEHRLTATIIGYFLLFIIFHTLFIWVESMHTQEYKLLFNEYIDSSFSQFIEAGQNIK